eukprot:CAMPEP_0114984518 /NCGR_PEP_ID=MMETSP0216-20121206/7318_1 /TAXON_ID=223996 /ORGANISM="Protocruzia adherens, Strain Boccale" /LENGTH=159 /DNA_ID=CAMNT_0002346657 /DNA_START=596 /DNA_END=1075 /DNA_ORIENTATION=-
MLSDNSRSMLDDLTISEPTSDMSVIRSNEDEELLKKGSDLSKDLSPIQERETFEEETKEEKEEEKELKRESITLNSQEIYSDASDDEFINFECDVCRRKIKWNDYEEHRDFHFAEKINAETGVKRRPTQPLSNSGSKRRKFGSGNKKTPKLETFFLKKS